LYLPFFSVSVNFERGDFMQDMDANDFGYMTFHIAHHIKKYKVPLEVVQSAGRKYIEYYKNPDVNNIGNDDEEEIIAWLGKFDTPPSIVFEALKQAMKQQ
jgi:hypothetical protein